MERTRSRKRKSWIVPGAIFFFALIFFVFLFFSRGARTPGNRKTVVLVGDPVTVLSYDRSNGSFLMVTLPGKTVIEGVHGYGSYSVESLWKLGHIEGLAGSVASQSLEELLAVPIPWYIGGRDYSMLTAKDPLALAKTVFSVPRVFTFLRGGYTSNMSIADYLKFAWTFLKHPVQIETIDLTSSLIRRPLPDGSTDFTVDMNLLDQKLGTSFEDSQIRREAYTVAVFNTTPTVSLGTRVSRMLTRSGMLVVAVANDRPTVGRCTIRGIKKILESHTAAFIAGEYGCAREESTESRADLTIRIGTQYQGRFLPFTTK